MMRLRFLSRIWRAFPPRGPRRGGRAGRAGRADEGRELLAGAAAPAGERSAATPGAVGGGRHRRDPGMETAAARTPAGHPAGQWTSERKPEPPPFGSPVQQSHAAGARAAGGPRHAAVGQVADRAGVRTRSHPDFAPRGADDPAAVGATVRAATARAGADRTVGAARLPWYEVAHARQVAAGRQHCGPLEKLLFREWPEGAATPESAQAIARLAELPAAVKESLLAGIDSIHVGPGGVPDLDDMSRLHDVPLPSGRATWDACAGAYGERKIIVGTRPSAAPDVMCHEVGHALDDIDGPDGGWQSDEEEFRALYERCLPRLVSDFHCQRGSLGRREFFADSFAAIASRQRPALVDMLGGHTRSALEVMLYFNLRYGI